MAASVGFLVQESGLHFSGYLSKTPEISFESLSGMGALAAWAAVPALGKAQIMTAAGLIEAFAEAQKPVRSHIHAASAARWCTTAYKFVLKNVFFPFVSVFFPLPWAK